MELSDQNFKTEVEEKRGLILVDFFAPWCGPCKILEPIIKELADEYKNKEIKIFKINIDENKEIADKYNIMSIPTIVLFKDGKKINQVIGLQAKEVLKELIDNNL